MSSTLDTPEVKPRIKPSEISMIADDLAGSCDTGIEFLNSVGCVAVVIDSDIRKLLTHCDPRCDVLIRI